MVSRWFWDSHLTLFHLIFSGAASAKFEVLILLGEKQPHCKLLPFLPNRVSRYEVVCQELLFSHSSAAPSPRPVLAKDGLSCSRAAAHHIPADGRQVRGRRRAPGILSHRPNCDTMKVPTFSARLGNHGWVGSMVQAVNIAVRTRLMMTSSIDIICSRALWTWTWRLGTLTGTVTHVFARMCMNLLLLQRSLKEGTVV